MLRARGSGDRDAQEASRFDRKRSPYTVVHPSCEPRPQPRREETGTNPVDQDFRHASRLSMNIPQATAACDLFLPVPRPKSKVCPAAPLPLPGRQDLLNAKHLFGDFVFAFQAGNRETWQASSPSVDEGDAHRGPIGNGRLAIQNATPDTRSKSPDGVASHNPTPESGRPASGFSDLRGRGD